MAPPRFKLIFLVALSAVGVIESALLACPFCGANLGPTLSKEAASANFVVYGALKNPKVSANADGTESSSTELEIEGIVKNHDYLKTKKTVTLSLFLPPTQEKALVFCEILRDRIDPYRGMAIRHPDLVAYLRDALKVDGKSPAERLTYFFKFLQHEDLEISGDAFREFGTTDYAEVVKMTSLVGRSVVRSQATAWLRNKETPVYRFGLYGLLLGLCGEPADVQVFLEVLNDPERGLVTGVDGILAGAVLVDKNAGWNYLLEVIRDEKKPFNLRYAGLRTLRFFWEYRADFIAKEQIRQAFALLLKQPDIADLVMDDLRRYKDWRLTDQILTLEGKPDFDLSPIHRAMIRYVLTCPEEFKTAKTILAKYRATDPDQVLDVEELLKFEAPPGPGSSINP